MRTSSCVSRLWTVVLTGAMALSVWPLAMAEPGDRQRGPARMESRLGLNQAQMARMQDIREQARSEAESLKARIRQKRDEQMRITSGGAYDESRVMRLNAEINQMQGRLGELRIRTLGQMKGVMTPEQYAEFAQMRSEARERMRERMQDNPGRSRQWEDHDAGAPYGNQGFRPPGGGHGRGGRWGGGRD